MSKLVILSAGGTGGHVMPARALARDLEARGYEVHWVTDERGLKFKDLFEGIPVHVIKAGTLGRGILGKIKGLLALGLGLIQAWTILRRHCPALVVGFGGYPSFPAVYAAQLKGIPTLLHEQNAILGKANAMLAGKAVRIASSAPVLQGADEKLRGRTVFTGNPVREEIAALYDEHYPSLKIDGDLQILVMGGSLGAHVFSEVLPRAFAMLPVDQRARLKIVQQCRVDVLEETRTAYEEAGIKAELLPFIHDVATEIARAHLFIGRSGASSVVEMTIAGRPAIYVPYPHHKDQQQKINADLVADAGGAWVMTENGFTPEALLARIETFLQNPLVLSKAADKSRPCARPDAARRLGDLVDELTVLS